VATVGTLAIRLGLDSTPFERGLVASTQKLAQFAGSVANIGRNVFSGVFTGGNAVDMIFGVLKGAVSGVTSTLQNFARSIPKFGEAIAAAIGFVGGAIEGALSGVQTFIGFFRGMAVEIRSSKDQADRFGISLESMGGLMRAARGHSEALTTGLAHLQRSLGAPGADFSAGLRRLGLDAQQLASVPLDEAFGQIADKIKALPSPAERAAAAFQLFGRAGSELVPMLQRGSDGLKRAQDQARAFGLAISGVDATKVAIANNYFAELDGILQGIKTQIVVQAAPYIAILGHWLENLGISGVNMGEVISTAFKLLISAAGALGQSFKMLFIDNILTGLLTLMRTMHLVASELAKLPGEAGKPFRDMLGTLEKVESVLAKVRGFDINSFATSLIVSVGAFRLPVLPKGVPFAPAITEQHVNNPALISGSKEALSALLKFGSGSGTQSAQAEAAMVRKQQLEELRKIHADLARQPKLAPFVIPQKGG
jgi:hypothetical protein